MAYAKKVLRNVACLDSLRHWRGYRNDSLLSTPTEAELEQYRAHSMQALHNPRALGTAWQGNAAPTIARGERILLALHEALSMARLRANKTYQSPQYPVASETESEYAGASATYREGYGKERPEALARTFDAKRPAAPVTPESINEANRKFWADRTTRDASPPLRAPKPTKAGSAWLHRLRADTRDTVEQMNAAKKAFWNQR